MTEPSSLKPFDDGKRMRRQDALKVVSEVVSDDVDTEGLNPSSALADISAMHSKTLQYSNCLSRGLTGPHSDFMNVVRSGLDLYFRAISDMVRDDAQARKSLQMHEKHNHTGTWMDPTNGEKTVFCHLGRLNEVDFIREESVGFSVSLGHECPRATVAHYDEEDGEQTFWRRTDSDGGGDTWQQRKLSTFHSDLGPVSSTDAEQGGNISEGFNELRL
ncbi:uncharacterized protein L199_002732 [Kwoniella botswanensis]|uniref:uncharacterized protein n=1 Tax=Kwoniella botswanensis TaxID=1268659 RepID=UPI00315CF896